MRQRIEETEGEREIEIDVTLIIIYVINCGLLLFFVTLALVVLYTVKLK